MVLSQQLAQLAETLRATGTLDLTGMRLADDDLAGIIYPLREQGLLPRVKRLCTNSALWSD